MFSLCSVEGEPQDCLLPGRGLSVGLFEPVHLVITVSLEQKMKEKFLQTLTPLLEFEKLSARPQCEIKYERDRGLGGRERTEGVGSNECICFHTINDALCITVLS